GWWRSEWWAVPDVGLPDGRDYSDPAVRCGPGEAVGDAVVVVLRPAVHVDVVVVVGVAGAEQAAEAVVPRLLGDPAQRRRARHHIGRHAIQMLAVRGAAEGIVAGDAPEPGGHGQRVVTQRMPQRLQLPHLPQRVGLGRGRRDRAAVPAADAVVVHL